MRSDAIELQNLEIFTYALPLKRPLQVGRVAIQRRQGWLLRLTAKGDIFGWGEAAPLPGLHREEPEEMDAMLRSVRKAVAGRHLPAVTEHLTDALAVWPGASNWPVSLRFGMESAAINLLAAATEVIPARLLSPTARSRISLNGLASGTARQLVGELQHLAAENYPAVKLKVGRLTLAEDVRRVRKARELLPPHVSLRLDANRAWSLPEAVRFVREIGPERIEYLEEPLQDPAGLPQFWEETHFPLALDETLAELPSSAPWPRCPLAAVVLKPGVLGGIFRTREWALRAMRHGARAVVSSAFESGVGLAMLAHLAATLNATDVPAGLDTFRWLKADVLTHPFPVERGQIDLFVLQRIARQVNRLRLQPSGE